MTLTAMKQISTLFLIISTSLFLSACSPHPGSGVWKANAENKEGITKLIVSFEGKAEFVSTNKGNSVWHCFWTIYDKNTLNLDCSPSTNTEEKAHFFLAVDDQGIAKLQRESTVLATFNRIDENPTLKK